MFNTQPVTQDELLRILRLIDNAAICAPDPASNRDAQHTILEYMLQERRLSVEALAMVTQQKSEGKRPGGLSGRLVDQRSFKT